MIAFRVEMPELVDAGEGHLLVGIIDDGGALEVGDVMHLALEVDSAPAQVAATIAEEAVDWSRIDDELPRSNTIGDVEIVDAELDLDLRMLEHPAEDRRVAVGRH